MDVYDITAWSAVTPLSEFSIENDEKPQDFPDLQGGTGSKENRTIG